MKKYKKLMSFFLRQTSEVFSKITLFQKTVPNPTPVISLESGKAMNEPTLMNLAKYTL